MTSLPGRVVGLVMVHPAGFPGPVEFGRREFQAHGRPRRLLVGGLRGLGLPVNTNGFPPMYPPSAINIRTYLPTVTFQTLSGNTSTPAVGDVWTVTVTGAKPGAQIAVNTNVQGLADPSGSFSRSGTFTPDVVGSYQENWTADGVSMGVWNFTVVPGPSLPGSVQPIQPGQLAPTQTAVGATATAPSSFWSNTFAGIPIWFLAAAGLAILAASYAPSPPGGSVRGRR